MTRARRFCLGTLSGSLSGIPIFAMALGDFANTFVQRYISAKERHAIQQPLNADEFEFAQTLFKKDSKARDPPARAPGWRSGKQAL